MNEKESRVSYLPKTPISGPKASCFAVHFSFRLQMLLLLTDSDSNVSKILSKTQHLGDFAAAKWCSWLKK
jgi:hypothetical protein